MRSTRVLVALAVMLALGSHWSTPLPAGPAPVTDPLGVVRVGQGNPITIAYWLVVSGPDAPLGIDARRGVELAIADRGGRLLGHPIKFIGEDDGCSAEGGVAAATKLSVNKEIVAAVGASCSSAATAGAPILWKAGIPSVSPSSTAPKLTAPDRPAGLHGYLRTAYNDNVQGRVAARFAWDVLKAKTAATIHDGSPYAEQLVGVFEEHFKRMGGRVTNREAISPQDTDMRPVLTRIAVSAPALIYFPIFVAAGTHITRQAREIEALKEVTLMTGDSLLTPDYVKAAGSAVVGIYLTGAELSVEVLGPRYREFLTKYQKKYGEKPISFPHAYGYDAASIIFAAIEKVGKRDTAGTLWIGRKAVRDALFATKNFKGISGTITCNPHGDCADPKIAIYRFMDADVTKWNPGVSPKKVYP